MEIVFLVLFMAVLAHVGWKDYKTRLISDLDLSILWCLIILLSLDSFLGPVLLLGAIFSVSYLGLYSLPIEVYGKPIMRFGDILLLPAMTSFGFLMLGLFGIYLTGAILGISLIVSFKKELPFGTVMSGFGLILVSLHYLNGVV